MFGQNDTGASQPQTPTDDAVNAAMPEPVQSDTASTMQPPDGWGLGSDPATTPVTPATDLDTTAAEAEAAAKIAEAAIQDSTPAADPIPAPADEPTTAPLVDNAASTPASAPVTTPADDLSGLKQEVMQHLSPLVGQLDQSPEEKFRTTMMMIQASDNHTLIKDAFEAAKQIADDKARAQALLDVINEINYFSQQGSGGSDSPAS